MNDVAVLCDICGRIAGHTCKNCGRRVCDKHYDAPSGWCSSCASGKKAKVARTA